MSLFGSGFGFPQLFGGTRTYGTPGIGDGQRQWDDAPMQQAAPQGGGWGEKLGNLGTGLMAAQASIDGDFGTATQIMGLQRQQAEAARKQAEQAAQQRQLLMGLKAQGLTDEQALLVLNNAGSIGDFRQKPPNNDTVNDYNFIMQNYGKAQADQFMQNRYDPIVSIPLPGGQTYMGPRSRMPGAPQAGGLPTVNDEVSYNALPAGTQYRDPNGNVRTKGGGAGSGASNFHVPSGNPLTPPR